MKRLLTILVAVLMQIPLLAQGHLRVGDLQLAKPYSEVVKVLRAKGFIEKCEIEEGKLMLGKFWGYTRAAAIPMRTNDSCYMLMMIVPEPATAKELFSTYNKIRARVTEEYGVYGKEENLYIDENVNDFSPIESKIAAARYGQAILYTQFHTQEGDIDVSINQHEATGLGVFVIFRDRDYQEDLLQQMPQGVIVEENKKIEPTTLKGVQINRPTADVVRDLKANGLRDEMSLMERWFYQKHQITKLRGEVFGTPGCDVTVHGEDRVELVTVNFPAMTEWRSLYALYTKLRTSIATRYGSIYRNDDQVAGVTRDLETLSNEQALSAIRAKRAHLETMLLNSYDGHAFKVVIAYSGSDQTYRVSLVCYTPGWLATHLNAPSL